MPRKYLEEHAGKERPLAEEDIENLCGIELLHCIFVFLQVRQVQAVCFALTFVDDGIGVNKLHRHTYSPGSEYHKCAKC
jgi:hypothetical protein